MSSSSLNLLTLLHWFYRATDLLIPHECHVCEQTLYGNCLCELCKPRLPVFDSSNRCTSCWEILSQSGECLLCTSYPLIINSLRFLWEYSGDARLFLHAIKYRPSRTLATIAGQMLNSALGHVYPTSSWDFVIPVPASPTHLRKRGFNQCEVFARELSSTSKLVPNSLKLSRKTVPQSQLTHEKRLKRKKLFTCDADMSGKRILLVDDVLTTGTTITRASEALFCAGAQAVDAVVLAKIPEFSSFRAALYGNRQVIASKNG